MKRKLIIYDAYGNHREAGIIERALRWAWLKLKGK